MVRILHSNASDGVIPEGIRRVETSAREAADVCREVIDAVRARGDDALIEYTRRFDGVDLSSLGLQVGPEEFESADQNLSADMREALTHAIRNINRFHTQQRPKPEPMMEVEPGVWCGDRWTPIDSVCLYVPRGRGAFSSVMCMLGVPAVVAGVERVVVCTPPGPDGRVDDATLVAAKLIGIDRVYRIGGAQAVAAMAFGTDSVEPSTKIVGPGNVYVSAARHLLSDRIDPGPPAGPSESVVLCDAGVDPNNAAWNVLVEAEHGENSCAVLVTHDEALAGRVSDAVVKNINSMSPQRQAFASQVLNENGGIVLTESLEASVDFVNAFAPEHLAIMSDRGDEIVKSIRNAGEILIGDFPIISLGNYAMGLNAILPTGGRAVTRSCVSVLDFLKRSSVGKVNREGFGSVAPVVSVMSRDEGFSAHHLAVENWLPVANEAE
ncbi:MAG: putative histidinol dehydrogenase 2 [Phycisphaerae bacterium]|nr:MAG: putative histidinol dehydrogenase 2 [Phycisphaerae bacterium]